MSQALAMETKVKERPILFSSPMVRAILEGRKTQTRRVTKFKPTARERGLNLNASSLSLGHYCTGVPTSGWVLYAQRGGCWNQVTERLFCPYGKVGDRLWVRETHVFIADSFDVYPSVVYKADDDQKVLRNLPEGMTVWNAEKPESWKWRPSIFMPRAASRITLEITEVRVERLQDISEADAIAEGVRLHESSGVFSMGESGLCYPTARDAFAKGWDKINGKRGYTWESNPFVWVVSFRRIGQPSNHERVSISEESEAQAGVSP